MISSPLSLTGFMKSTSEKLSNNTILSTASAGIFSTAILEPPPKKLPLSTKVVFTSFP